MKWVYDDGGRSKYYHGVANDCVCRAIAIATGTDYKKVYDMIKIYADDYRTNEDSEDNSHPSMGVSKKLTYKILTDLGFIWVPKMFFGKGCTTHLKSGELPKGKTLIVSVSKHLTCVKDNVIYDTYDTSRKGTRCVYGYYVKP